METSVKILTGINDEEKGAYLAAIASIATADTEASPIEVDHLTHLCEAADLSEEQKKLVMNAATGTSDADLIRSLDILKTSDLRFCLVTDLFAFAKSDGNYSESEQQSVQKISTYLGIDQAQFGLLGELAEKTNAIAASDQSVDGAGMLSAFGLGDKLKESGINGGGLLKGLVSIAAPLILAKMMGRNSSSAGNAGGGLGGLLSGSGGLGGLLGGSGAASGGGLLGGGGGLGSLIGMLNGGKGMGAAGGLLGRIFG